MINIVFVAATAWAMVWDVLDGWVQSNGLLVFGLLVEVAIFVAYLPSNKVTLNLTEDLLAEMREETYGPPAKKVGSSMETLREIEGTGYSTRALRKARQRVAKGLQRPGAPVMKHLD